jgi:hypothetical protein
MLHRWEDHPKRERYREANDGLGMCNTGAHHGFVCVLGGIGCDVDHIGIVKATVQDLRAELEALHEEAMEAG